MSVRERLEKIVRDVLEDPNLEFSDELSAANCAAWDSVATVQIVLAVEAEFDVHFKTSEVAEVQGVSDLLGLLPKYGVADSAAD